MLGDECTLPMDVGLPRRNHDMPDSMKNLYAYVGPGMRCKLPMIRSVVMWVWQHGDKNYFYTIFNTILHIEITQ